MMAYPPLENFVKNGRKIYAAIYHEKLAPEDAWKQIKEPILFLRTPSDLVTKGRPVVIPRDYTLLGEVRLGAVIGKTCKKVSVEDALDCVGGYCVAVELTAINEWRKCAVTGGPWTKAKFFDTSCPVSSFIPKDAIPDPNNVEIFATINGKLQQSGNTSQWVFSLAELINFITQIYTLEPNDVVFGGTAATPGLIKAGDVIKGGIKGGVVIEFCPETEL